MHMESRSRSRMVRFGLSLASVFLWSASAYAAAAPPRSVYFWNSAAGTQGTRAGVDSARVGVWGNGEQRIARDVKYEDADTLKVTTRNFREGVRFDLKTPLDIEQYRESGYVRFRVRFDQLPVAAPQGVGEPGMPGEPGLIPGMEPGMLPGVNPGFGGAVVQPNFQLGPLPPLGAMPGIPGMPGMEGIMPAVPVGPAPQETPITKLLVTLVLENGVLEGTIDVPKSFENPRRIDFDKVRPDANGWLLFTLAVKDMRSTPGASGALQRMILSADRQDSFWLTQAALVVETGAIQVSIRQLNNPPGTPVGEITVRPGPITLVADVEAGAADPAIEWNFDADNVGNLPLPVPEGMQPGMPGVVPGMAPEIEPGMDPGMMPGMPQAPAIPLGPRIDARGLVAKFEYPNEEQNYRVEVTVRDRSGKKEPATASILVKVRG